MKSIAFPNIFTSSKVNIVSNKEATYSNLYLLLNSHKGSLFGDPYYGTDLIKYIYEQNNLVLVDLIKDEIYTLIIEYIPQLSLNKDDIIIRRDKSILYADISAINLLSGESDLYSIRLIEEGDV